MKGKQSRKYTYGLLKSLDRRPALLNKKQANTKIMTNCKQPTSVGHLTSFNQLTWHVIRL